MMWKFVLIVINEYKASTSLLDDRLFLVHVPQNFTSILLITVLVSINILLAHAKNLTLVH